MKKALVFADKSREKIKKALADALPMVREFMEVEVMDMSTHQDVACPTADIAIVFGGDGSMLRVARSQASSQIPTIGVNLGKIGFLTEISLGQLRPAIEALAAGRYEVTPRMMLKCQATRGRQIIRESLALNDVVVSRRVYSRMISVGLSIDDEHVIDYNADGMIISTPVGSTAYSLAAGGSILEADLRAFALTPICPHTLSNRPLVIPATRKVELLVNPVDLPVALTIDGQLTSDLIPGDRVTVQRADNDFKLIQMGTRSYYQILHTKLGWGGHPNYGKS